MSFSFKAVCLSARYIRAPSTEANTIHTDFFMVETEQKLVTLTLLRHLLEK